MMPVDPKRSKPAASKTKRRGHKIQADGPAATKAPAKSSRATVVKAAAPAPAEAKPAAAKPAPADEPMTVFLNGVPTPIVPLSLLEPASAEARRGTRPAAPIPENQWNWARAPLAATVAFLGVLAILMAGYWTGYSVGTGNVEDPAVTVAQASEKTEAPTSAPAPAEVVAPAPETAVGSETGLHLQVSALRSPSAASELRAELEKRGFPARIDQASEDALVRVYVGPIADKAELQMLTSALRKEGLKPFPKRL